jgi:hypothetical protein
VAAKTFEIWWSVTPDAESEWRTANTESVKSEAERLASNSPSDAAEAGEPDQGDPPYCAAGGRVASRL